MAGVSVEQVSALLDFLEENPELALGRCTRSKEGRSLAKRLWKECALILNSVSSVCVHKSGDNWRVYYNEYKSKLLKKIRIQKGEISATGGGPASNITFTPLQDRLYTILGRDVGEPLPGVRHNPIITLQESVELPLHNTLNMETEAFPDHSPIISITTPMPSTSANARDMYLMPSTSAGIGYASELTAPELLSSPTPSLHPRRPDRPRKSQQQRREDRRQSETALGEVVSMQQETASLEAMEHINADAMHVHAQATYSLAAAINRLAEVIEDEARGPRTRRRIRRIIYSSSESDI